MNSIEDPIVDEIDEDAPIPGTVFNKRQARMLKYLVIIMGLMLIGGFALMIGIIAHRASQPATRTEPIAPAGVSVPQSTQQLSTTARNLTAPPPAMMRTIKGLIPAGTTYLDSTINGDRLVLTLQTGNKGLQLLLIDLKNWQIIGKALLQPAE